MAQFSLTFALLCFTTASTAQAILPAKVTPAITPSAVLAPPVPWPTTSTPACNETICIDKINECGDWYGGCFPICPGYTIPAMTAPPCRSTSSVQVLPVSSTITLAPALFPTEWASNPAASGCSRGLCIDYVNTCDIKYGGCFLNCPGYSTPVYTDPGCPAKASIFSYSSKSFSKLPVTTRTNACGLKCDDYVDSCGQTFGPGCYTSCPGVAPPSFTRPYCETSIATTLVQALATAVL